MIIGLTGFAQTGKDTVAKVLCGNHNYERRAFADNVRSFVYDLDIEGLRLVVDTMGWEKAKQLYTVRRWLQKVGLSARNILGENVWITSVTSNLTPFDKVVITDVRFLNEAEAIKNLGGEIWRVERPGVGPVNDHISETELMSIEIDHVITNVGTFEELELLVNQKMSSYAKN